MRKTVFSHTCFRSCFVSLLVLLLPLTSASSASPENHHTSGDVDVECVNRMLGNVSSWSTVRPDSTCLNQHFPELCDLQPVSNEQWMLYTSHCTITIHSVTKVSKQVISLEKCQTIYKCWLVFNDIAVCFYLSSTQSHTPARRLRLYLLNAQQGRWTKSARGSEHVFTQRTRVGKISSSVALRQALDDEKGRIIEFIIGNDNKLLTVRLLLDELSSESSHPIVCKTKVQVAQVLLAGTNNLIVFCENQMKMRNLEIRNGFVDITPAALSDISLRLAKTFFSRSGKTVFLIITSQGNTIYCFIFLDIQHTSNRCKVVPDSSNFVTDGVFINEQSLGLLDNANTFSIINVTFDPLTTITNVSCSTNNCYLYQTQGLLYIYDQRSATVFDKTTYNTVTSQNASIYEVLLRVERANYNCLIMVPSTPTTTTATIPISLTAIGSGSQPILPSNTDVKISSTTFGTSINNISAQNSASFTTAINSVYSIAITATSYYSTLATSTSNIGTSVNISTQNSVLFSHSIATTIVATTTGSHTTVTASTSTHPITTQVAHTRTAAADLEKSSTSANTKNITIIVVLSAVGSLPLIALIFVLVFCWHRRSKETLYRLQIHAPLVPVYTPTPYSVPVAS